MDRKELLILISTQLGDVLGIDDLQLTESSRADNIEDWDSINHVRLLIALERELGIEFGADESGSLENVGALIDLIQTKTS